MNYFINVIWAEKGNAKSSAFSSLCRKFVVNLPAENEKSMETRTTQFATLAIGATARHMGISPTELHNRLKRYDLVRKLLFDCYDTLHTESIEGVVWNVTEALRVREEKEAAK